MATYEQVIAKARELAAAGDTEGAKRLGEIAIKMRGQPAQQPVAPSQDTAIFDELRGKTTPVSPDDPIAKAQVRGEAVPLVDSYAQGLTFGGSDELAGALSAMTGGSYDEGVTAARARLDAGREKAPGTAAIGELLGAVSAPVGAIGTLGKGASLLPRVAASAATGAGMGGAYGFMTGEGLDDRASNALSGAKWGGVIGAAVPAVGAGVQKIADSIAADRAVKAIARKAPTSEALRAQGQAAYKAIDDAGVSIRPDVVKRGMVDIVEALKSEGLGMKSADKVLPGASAVMGAADDFAQSSNTVPFRDVDMLRRFIGNASTANAANKADSRLTSNAMGQLDDFVRNLGPNDVDAGDLETLQTMLPKARDVWARMSRSQLIDDAISAGNESYLSGGASGIRNQFKRILKNPKLSRGFSDAEKKVMSKVINGPDQILHLLGGGLGNILTVTGSALGGGLPGAVAGMGAAAGLRKASEAVANRRAEIARALVAGGGLKQLPVASDASRKIIERLLRQGTAAALQ